jgi:hypothetical protein
MDHMPGVKKARLAIAKAEGTLALLEVDEEGQFVITGGRTQAMSCTCVSCPDCNGSGYLWETLDGKIHSHRCDDMGDLVTCENCHGSGLSERCWECERTDEEDFYP